MSDKHTHEYTHNADADDDEDVELFSSHMPSLSYPDELQKENETEREEEDRAAAFMRRMQATGPLLAEGQQQQQQQRGGGVGRGGRLARPLSASSSSKNMLLSGQRGGGGGGREGGGGGGGGGGGMVVMRKEGRALGLSSLPRRVGSTLKRKLWDSNDLVSSTAVQARDILATLYVSGRQSTVQLIREGSHRHYYHELKRLVPALPLGSTLLLPALAFGEGLAHVTLIIVQAPLPSAERVASTVELAMDMSKRGMGVMARECYYYIQ
ncbi:Hypothetical protein NocV09_11400010, partial [Nannochloropsis oceanica]